MSVPKRPDVPKKVVYVGMRLAGYALIIWQGASLEDPSPVKPHLVARSRIMRRQAARPATATDGYAVFDWGNLSQATYDLALTLLLDSLPNETIRLTQAVRLQERFVREFLAERPSEKTWLLEQEGIRTWADTHLPVESLIPPDEAAALDALALAEAMV